MNYCIGPMLVTPYLEHHGILGMKWGRRRYQNEDGTLTAAGRARYGVGDPRMKRGQSARARNARRVKITKGLMVAGGAALAGSAAYALYKYGKSEKTHNSTIDVLKKNNKAINSVLNRNLRDDWGSDSLEDDINANIRKINSIINKMNKEVYI